MRNALITFNEFIQAVLILFLVIVITYIVTFNSGELPYFSSVKWSVLFLAVLFIGFYFPLSFLKSIVFEKMPKKNSQLILPFISFFLIITVTLFLTSAIKNYIVQTQEIYPARYEGKITAVEEKDYLLFGPHDMSKYFVYSSQNSGYPNRYGLRLKLATGEQFHLVFFYESERDELLNRLQDYVNESVVVSAFPQSKKVLHIFPLNNSYSAIFVGDIESIMN